MKAGWIRIGRFPCKVSSWCGARSIYPQKVYLVLLQRLSSPNNTQIYNQFGLPSIFCPSCWILNSSTVLEHRRYTRAISVAVCDICEEKCRRWTNFKLKIVSREWIQSCNKSLDCIGIVKWVIAVTIGRNNLIVDACPSDDKLLIIMAELGPSCWIRCPINISEV